MKVSAPLVIATAPVLETLIRPNFFKFFDILSISLLRAVICITHDLFVLSNITALYFLQAFKALFILVKFPTNLNKATSLKIETGVSYNPEKLAVELQKIVVSNFELFIQNPEKLLNDYNKLLFRKSKTIKYKSKTIKINEGDIVSVDQYGKFLIRNVNGIVKKFKENEIKLNY